METPKAEQAGSVNAYRCEDGDGITWVRHIDAGVTPFMLSCLAPGCRCGGAGMAASRMYRAKMHVDTVGYYEWWRPRDEAAARIAGAAAVDRMSERSALAKANLARLGRENAIQQMVDHWKKGGCYLRKSDQPWGPGAARPTLATPGVEPISREGIEPTPGDLGIFRSIADMATRGLVHFVGEGEVIPKGLSFKRWPARQAPLLTPGGMNVTANLMGDGFRMRMLVRPGQEPLFELLIDNPSDDSGKVTVPAVLDALKNPHETRIEFLERALADAREQAQQEQVEQAKAKP